jgi:hypothetical protein
MTIPGSGIDEAVGRLVVEMVTPLALEVALSVQAEIESRAAEADQLRRGHVERARHNAESARRRYLCVDPDNRLVADTLEADWNAALRELADAQDDYDRASEAAREALSEEHKSRIRSLATDFPALWNDPATPQREKKRMIRLLVEDVTIERSDVVRIHVRLRGGQTTSLTRPLPLTVGDIRRTSPETVARCDELLDDHTDAEVAELLNKEGILSGGGKPFLSRTVLRLRRDHHLLSQADRLARRGLLTLPEMAAQLGVTAATVKHWHHVGLLTAHKANDKGEHLYEGLRPVIRASSRTVDGISPSDNYPNQPQEVQCEAKPLARGARTGVLITRMPSEPSTSSKLAVNLVSRSRTRNLMDLPRSARSATRFRASWVTKAPVGCSAIPRMCTSRVASSITKST